MKKSTLRKPGDLKQTLQKSSDQKQTLQFSRGRKQTLQDLSNAEISENEDPVPET